MDSFFVFWRRCLAWAFLRTDRADSITVTLSVAVNWTAVLATLGVSVTEISAAFKILPPLLLAVLILVIAPYQIYRRAAEDDATEKMKLWDKNGGLRHSNVTLRRQLTAMNMNIRVELSPAAWSWLDDPDVNPDYLRSDRVACLVRGLRVVNKSKERVDLSFTLHGTDRTGDLFLSRHRWSPRDVKRWWMRLCKDFPSDDYFPPDHIFNLGPGETSEIGTLTFLVSSIPEGLWHGGEAFLRIEEGLVHSPDIPLVHGGVYIIDTGSHDPLTRLNNIS